MPSCCPYKLKQPATTISQSSIKRGITVGRRDELQTYLEQLSIDKSHWGSTICWSTATWIRRQHGASPNSPPTHIPGLLPDHRADICARGRFLRAFPPGCLPEHDTRRIGVLADPAGDLDRHVAARKPVSPICVERGAGATLYW
ncbi:hypothetical protein O1611_g6898 [Lasiodiplodia mahajangana]|uniref:Uncharacterized protein n=1 Tax=Lasiodiplodia mahajangana TaxID=1108764 RepID=A0ACC2JGU2_9PEZI|nr:hypothetical protein O1611_g6898 [Lasiodiplodia mahajangana]